MVFNDKELGMIVARYNAQSKRIIARYNKDHIVITLPVGFNKKNIPDIIEEMRPQLSSYITKKKEREISIADGMIIQTASKPIHINISDDIKSLGVSNNNVNAIINIPSSLDVDEENNLQQILYVINNIIYQDAQKVLIPKTIQYASKHNLEISNVRINTSRTRWGSCSNKKSINLSYYLMLLPKKLIDYVILHELAHTIEMNHSPAFWKLLDKLCGEDSKAISKIARVYTSEDLELIRRY